MDSDLDRSRGVSYLSAVTPSRNLSRSRWAWLLVPGLVSCTAELVSEADDNAPLEPNSPASREEPDCTKKMPGHAPLRRLSREEYRYTVEDLLDVRIDALEDLTPDEQIGAFRSNATVALSSLSVEKYTQMAERVVARVNSIGSLFDCPEENEGDPACAEAFIEQVGKRAYRRPLSEEEVERYLALFEHADRNFDSAARLALIAMLQSPHFLYRIETVSESTSIGEVSPYELASRLSYFLWKSMPDSQLMEAAESGKLDDPEEFEQQVISMLDDARVERTLESFTLQWLDIEELEYLQREVADGVLLEPSVQRAMKQETVDYVINLVAERDGTFEDLLLGPSPEPSSALLPFYSPNPETGMGGNGSVGVSSERAGVLTQLSFLTAHAHVNQTSPVKRGLLVRNGVLCTDLPDPPANVNNTPPEPDADLTTRQRFGEHMDSPACKNCHELIDPIGFGFENYDSLGRYRSEEHGREIDSTAELVKSGADDGNYSGAVELSEGLAQSETAHRCFARQWFRYAMGRRESPSDRCALGSLETAFLASRGNVKELLLQLTMNDAFVLKGSESP